MGILFALDNITHEIVVSKSTNGSNKIDVIERIKQSENELLYNAVKTLTSITRSENFDAKIYDSMDKVCQMIYNIGKEN